MTTSGSMATVTTCLQGKRFTHDSSLNLRKLSAELILPPKSDKRSHFDVTRLNRLIFYHDADVHIAIANNNNNNNKSCFVEPSVRKALRDIEQHMLAVAAASTKLTASSKQIAPHPPPSSAIEAEFLVCKQQQQQQHDQAKLKFELLRRRTEFGTLADPFVLIVPRHSSSSLPATTTTSSQKMPKSKSVDKSLAAGKNKDKDAPTNNGLPPTPPSPTPPAPAPAPSPPLPPSNEKIDEGVTASPPKRARIVKDSFWVKWIDKTTKDNALLLLNDSTHQPSITASTASSSSAQLPQPSASATLNAKSQRQPQSATTTTNKERTPEVKKYSTIVFTASRPSSHFASIKLSNRASTTPPPPPPPPAPKAATVTSAHPKRNVIINDSSHTKTDTRVVCASSPRNVVSSLTLASKSPARSPTAELLSRVAIPIVETTASPTRSVTLESAADDADDDEDECCPSTLASMSVTSRKSFVKSSNTNTNITKSSSVNNVESTLATPPTTPTSACSSASPSTGSGVWRSSTSEAIKAYFVAKKSEWSTLTHNLVDSHCHFDMLFPKLYFNGTINDYFRKYDNFYLDNFEACINVMCDPVKYYPKCKRISQPRTQFTLCIIFSHFVVVEFAKPIL